MPSKQDSLDKNISMKYRQRLVDKTFKQLLSIIETDELKLVFTMTQEQFLWLEICRHLRDIYMCMYIYMLYIMSRYVAASHT